VSAQSNETEAFNDATSWAAVETRDVRFDGTFVYGVRTSGVYCRPSCPSRRPLRVNVTFYATAGAAETAGFRACKRCQPESASR
jgi:methylphosphotriester-DNA--protein-cysteine methyltransferase